jgi:hypothetical protein
LLAAEGPRSPKELAGHVLEMLGDRWVTSQGQPLDEAITLSDLHHQRAVLVGLDLIETSQDAWTAGPSARWLLPRATALAHLWSLEKASPPAGRVSIDIRRMGLQLRSGL